MGNRAVITTAPFDLKNVGIYVHWNGGRDSVEGFLRACKALGYRSPEMDSSYAMGRLTQAIGTYFGGATSLGIGTVDDLDYDNGDNGTYVIGGNWEIVGREYWTGLEDADEGRTTAIASKIFEALRDNAKE